MENTKLRRMCRKKTASRNPRNAHTLKHLTYVVPLTISSG